ncbi:MAG TPA: hypothetical protein VN193_16440 [Candidatus Angelobacter sp.]|jgi:hypothetical protein|nr:hypothetical protein [Candidatus Angelobacter sp.]
MRPPRRCLIPVAVLAAGLAWPSATLGVAAAGAPSIGPCPTLPADNVWNTDVSGLPVSPSSAAWIASSGGAGQHIHPDWGPSGTSVAYGIPWQLVDSSHQKVPVSFQYASESDAGPYPLGPDTPIEGGSSSTGDRHALVVDTSTCTLYETWDTHYASGGSTAGSGAVFSLSSNALRPAGWTSADAAGLPILPGLVRYGEVQAGAIRHAIRFTVSRTDTSYVWPARHQAGSAADASLPPMGARFRMKSSVDISGFSAQARVILTAMQRYGLILADNGSNWYFQGDTDPGWGSGVLTELKSIPAGDFEAVDESSLMVDPNSGQARQGTAPAPAPPPATPTPLLLHPVPPVLTPAPVAIAVPPPTDAPAPELSPSPAATPSPDTAVGATPSPDPSIVVAVPASRTTGGGPSARDALSAAIPVAAAAAGLGLFVASGVHLWQRRRRRRLLDG